MVPNNRESFLLCFLPWCCVLSGGKILGYSFSSPIPRNRDLQTRCYFNDLNLDFQQLSLVPMFQLDDTKEGKIILQYDRFGLYHCHCIILLEDLFIRTTPHNSNQQSPSTPSTAEWRGVGVYCETAEVCSWCILRVSCAFGLLSANALPLYYRSEHWAAEYPDIPSKT